MIVVDTSAWIELYRGTESPTHLVLRDLIDAGADLAITESVVMELLGGATKHRAALRKRLLAFPLLPLRGLRDFEEAAAIFRRCRNGGETLRRGFGDCLVAVPALREKASVLHHDRDFEAIARHTELQLAI
ncbi:MAG: PIN domain nuclease [Actinomycetota bacterium]|nr:PIN domain nuclease [Actinomycetota bacterium]